jgi:hypothetical protein
MSVLPLRGYICDVSAIPSGINLRVLLMYKTSQTAWNDQTNNAQGRRALSRNGMRFRTCFIGYLARRCEDTNYFGCHARGA